MADRPPKQKDVPPSQWAQVTPPMSQSELSVYETVLSLHTSMAQLTERVSHLVDASKSQSQKLEGLTLELNRISIEVHGAKVGFKVGAAIIGVVLAASVSFIAWLITSVLPAVLK